MSDKYLSLIAAVLCAIVGLRLLFVMRRDWHQGVLPVLSYATWFFLAAVPPLLFFALFPGATAEGEWLKFKVTGAFGAYVLIFAGVGLLTKKHLDRAAEERKAGIVAENTRLQARIAELEEKNKPAALLTRGDSVDYAVTGARNKTCSLFEGQLDRAMGFDAWVNSENTNMQMAAFFDRSVSGWIRYNGALEKDGRREDTIALELANALGDRSFVHPAEVLVTSAGALAGRGVRRIFHVATVTGQPGEGYSPIRNLGACVNNLLDKAEALNQSVPRPDSTAEVGSILIPLLATGSGGAPLEETARDLLDAAIGWLKDHPDSAINRVAFIVATEKQRDVCRQILASRAFADRVKSRRTRAS